jgi:YVTN family beta-propeller protein
MKLLKLKTFLLAFAVASIFSACRKNNVTPETPVLPGIYVLNQGNGGKNNSTLSFYNLTTTVVTPNQFLVANGVGLGDTGNDIQQYGSKLYITVNISSTVEVVDKTTAKTIKQLKFFNGAVARQPRFVVFNKNKAFISSYDGTIAVLDTATLTVDKYITVGRNPEQMVISNGKLYVANSGGLDYVNPDKTVSVIDLTTLTEIKKITVALNPVNIAADAYGDVYVISYGTYPSIPQLTIINNVTDVVRSSGDFDAGYATPLVVNGDLAYYISSANKVKVYNVKTDLSVRDNFVTDGTVITTPFGITVNITTGELFITDALNYNSNGTLFAFDKNGKKEYSTTVGINPGSIAIVNK